jgi:hypothetical protein
MDYHLKFRFESMNQASSALGQKQHPRLPMSSAPMLFRSKCKPVPLDGSTGTEDQTQLENSPLADRIRRVQKTSKDSPKVQKQVKQLQFWLKVFSRFCQDPAPEE